MGVGNAQQLPLPSHVLSVHIARIFWPWLPISLLSADPDEMEKAGPFLFCQGSAHFSLFIFLFAGYGAALSPSFLKGLDMLSVEGLCIQNGLGRGIEWCVSVDSSAAIGYEV